MKKHLLFVIGTLLAVSAHAQSKLPPCQGSDSNKWSSCFGTYTVDNAKYVGEFKDGSYHGQGTFTFADGRKYVGEFKNGAFYGRGTATNPDGSKYVGDWKDNRMNGKGTSTYAGGVRYVGEWKDGQYHGRGRLTFADGEKYDGDWKNGNFHGKGIATYRDGRVEEGIWDDDKFVRAEKINSPSQQTDLALNEDINTDLFVIQPQFDWVGYFSEGIAPVRIGDGKTGKYGFVDKQGKFVIKVQFDKAEMFEEGLAAVLISDKWGFIDKQGKMIINPQFDQVREFSEGFAPVLDYKIGKWGFIDKQGKMIISPKFDEADRFSEGLVAVRIGDYKTGKWGFIDKHGKMIIKPQFYAPYSRFKEGLAPVPIGDDTGRWGFIDKQGKMIIKPQFAHASSFKDGLAVVEIGNDRTGKYGFIDKQGKMIINPQFDHVREFSEGFAGVLDYKTGKWGFIDKQGKMIISPQFDQTDEFREGFALVRIGDEKTGKWDFIDKLGNLIINGQYENSINFTQIFGSFSDGLAPTCIIKNEISKCGFISKSAEQFSKLISVSHQKKNQDENKQQLSKLSLQVSTTIPDVNGTVIITVRTNTDTSSLKVNGNEEGSKLDGNYAIKRVARVSQDTEYTIVATDVFGNTASTTITVARQAVSSSSNQSAFLKPENIKRAATRDAVAIIIGIQNYKRVPKAEFANNDAKEFYEYAIRGLGIQPENIKLLIDEEADDVNIVKAFENWLPLQVNKGKTDVYVFYSGHGLPSADGKSLYFLPHGVDKELLTRTAVGQAEVVSALVASKPKSVTMFIDACYSGQTRGGEVLLASAKPIALKADTNAFPSNFTVITASSNDQISSSSPALKHGIFSFYLMKGMEGDADGNKDGKITAGEMQEYLSDKVSRQAMSMSRKQDTQLVGDVTRVLVTR